MNKIVIIDNHQLFLHGLKLTLENENNEVKTFDNPVKALQEIKAIQPDLIILDFNMPEIDGIQLIDLLLETNVTSSIVILSACENYQKVYSALQKKSVKGFIPKSYSAQVILDALQSILNGSVFIPPYISIELNKMVLLEDKNKPIFSLSARQMQVLNLIREGQSNRMIAEQLCISSDTVKYHQKQLYRTLQVSGVSSRFKAVEKALQVGLLKA